MRLSNLVKGARANRTNVELRRLIDEADAARVVFARSLLMVPT